MDPQAPARPWSAAPRVSVVIATYNRSQVLRHAIQSVRDSSFTDWEIIVVGDGCSDDTADCVASFGDHRIRFVNLPQRSGGQSLPNNHGVSLARGRLIAFLNHDDLYLPNHLGRCVAELDRTDADLVWAACIDALPNPEPQAGELPCRFTLRGAPAVAGYSPFGIYVASSWMFRKELMDRVGPWAGPGQVYGLPSQDWLFRAWRSGAALRFIRAVGVVLVPGGGRPGSYAQRHSPDHEWLASWIKNEPGFLARVLEEAALSEAIEHLTNNYHAPLAALKRLLLRPVHFLLTAAGIHPRWLRLFVHRLRGVSTVRIHRQVAGCPLENEGSPHQPTHNPTDSR